VSFRTYPILQGTVTTASTTVQLLPAGVTGTPGALRRLVHPNSALMPPLVYFRNPDRRGNFDAQVLRSPLATLVRTIDDSKLVRFEENQQDVIVTETWEGELSMPTFFFRLLYNYFINPPAFSVVNPVYIQWEPRDESTDVYNIEILDLQLGSGAPSKFDVRKYSGQGGSVIEHPGYGLDVSPTTFLDRPVTLTFRVVSIV